MHISFVEQKFFKPQNLLPGFCTNYRSEAQKALCLKRNWNNFDPQAYTLYGENQNHETSFKGKALQAVVDCWCKIQVLHLQQTPTILCPYTFQVLYV